MPLTMQPPARRAAAALGAGVALLAVCAVHVAYGGAASSGSGGAPAALGAAELRWGAASATTPGGEEKARARARLAEKQVSESRKGPAGVDEAEARAKLLFDDWGGIRKEREARQEEKKVIPQLLWPSRFCNLFDASRTVTQRLPSV